MTVYTHIPNENVSENRELIDELDDFDETEEALLDYLSKRKEQVEGRRENNPESREKSKSDRNQKNWKR